MSRNNTGNPIGSKAFPDFEDNVKNLDQAVNAEQDTFQDRLGKSRLTWAGMESQFESDQGEREVQFDADQAERVAEFNADQSSREQEFRTFIASSGYQFAGDYAAGIEITQYNQILRDENGEFWRVSGEVELPYTTTGAGIPEDDALVPTGDAVLRQQLADPSQGSLLVRGAVTSVSDISELESIDTSFLSDGDVFSVATAGDWRWDATAGRFLAIRQSALHPHSGRGVSGVPVYESQSGGMRLLEKGPAGFDATRKPMLVISYDDASSMIYDHAWPIHKEQNAPGIFYVCPGVIEGESTTSYTPIITWEQLREMYDYEGPGRIEIGHHSWTHPNYTQITSDELIYQVERANLEFAKRGMRVRHAAYPYNNTNPSVRSIISGYFDSARGKAPYIQDSSIDLGPEGINGFISHKGRMNPFHLPSLSTDTAPLSEVKAYIDAIKRENAFGFLYIHRISPTANITPEYLREVIVYARSVGVEIATPDEVLKSHGPDRYYNRNGVERWDNNTDLEVELPGGVAANKYILLCEELGEEVLSWSGDLYFRGSYTPGHSVGAGSVALSFSRGDAGVQVFASGGWVSQRSQITSQFRVVKLVHDSVSHIALEITGTRTPVSMRVVERSVAHPWLVSLQPASYLDVTEITPYHSDPSMSMAISSDGTVTGTFEHGSFTKYGDGRLEIRLEYSADSAEKAIAPEGQWSVEGSWPQSFNGSIESVQTGFMVNIATEIQQKLVTQSLTQMVGRPSGSGTLTGFRWTLFNSSPTSSISSFTAYAVITGRWRP